MYQEPAEIYEIQWTIYVAAKTKERAMLTLQSLEDIMQVPLQVHKMSQYWRDSSLYEILFTTPYFESDRPNAVYQSLIIANTLAWEWQVRSPGEWDGEFDFGAITTKTKVTGVTWASFDLVYISPEWLQQNQLLLEGTYYE